MAVPAARGNLPGELLGGDLFQECKLRGDHHEELSEELGATLGEDRWEARSSMGIFMWFDSFASKGVVPIL